MTETLARVRKFKVGRGGLRIPENDFSSAVTPPITAATFIRQLWSLNGIECSSAERNALGFGAVFEAQELVVPASGKRPLTVLRYRYEPPESNYDSPVEKHSLLVPPTDLGGFRPYLIATYRPRPAMGLTDRGDCLLLEHELGTARLAIDRANESYGANTQSPQHLLTLIMRELVDFVS